MPRIFGVFLDVLLVCLQLGIVLSACDAAPVRPNLAGASASSSTVSMQTTAPDDQDPMARKLAQEASAHRAAPLVPSAVSPESPEAAPSASASTSSASSASASASASASVPMFVAGPSSDAPPPAPPSRPASEAGNLVLALLESEDQATTTASALRWEITHRGSGGSGGGAWTNHVQAVHIYEKIWAVRVGPVTQTEASALCFWLLRPSTTEVSWMAKDPRRRCRYTDKPMLTSKTPYTFLFDSK
jgi:hypothetical protein